jgi:hypothetical protein
MTRFLRMITPAASGRVVSTEPSPATERFGPDFANWRAHLASQRSQFESAQPASPPVDQSDAVTPRLPQLERSGERRDGR